MGYDAAFAAQMRLKASAAMKGSIVGAIYPFICGHWPLYGPDDVAGWHPGVMTRCADRDLRTRDWICDRSREARGHAQ
ncbi:hypothetical protein AYM40_06665 [Paraburkholderia phytofirmans OLGA172]|uniref:Uncharacterized protein n=1 Tax=Paraburkholderia phytofirmans OLGA172 TaxID=1417228 RepID=A0A160FIJ3_9BURK|nr:hypothetical protein AYM40_06665 [Paraburkholderia phytofirmans OLGA172]